VSDSEKVTIPILPPTIPEVVSLWTVWATDSTFGNKTLKGIYSTKEIAQREAIGAGAWGSDGTVEEYRLDSPFDGPVRRCENCHKIIGSRFIYCSNECAIADA